VLQKPKEVLMDQFLSVNQFSANSLSSIVAYPFWISVPDSQGDLPSSKITWKVGSSCESTPKTTRVRFNLVRCQKVIKCTNTWSDWDFAQIFTG
jgi:hypothetical protein